MPTPGMQRDPFIGRAEELAALDAALAESRAKRGSVVALAGAPGAGKTRLLTEIASRAESAGHVVLWAQVLEDPAQPPYHPWRLLVRALADRSDVASIVGELGDGAGDLSDLLPELPRHPRAKVADRRGANARFRLFEAVTRLLLAAARTQPVLGLIDNLHLADRSSLLLLEHVGQQIAGEALCFVAAYRDAEVKSGHPLRRCLDVLARGPRFTHMSLRGFGRNEVAELLEIQTGQRISPQLTALVTEQTEGNPLFVREMGAQLVSELRRDPRLSERAVPKLRLPNGIADAIEARLDAVPPATRHALEAASVIGRDFDGGDLAVLLGGRRRGVLQRLEVAESLELIVPEGIPGRFRFAHALFREALYTKLSTVKRVALHERFAKHLEAQPPEIREDRLAEVAHHFLEAAPAGATARAIDYATRAGQKALALLAYEEAARHFERALDALDLDAEPNPEQRFELLVSLGTATRRSGELSAASRALLKACVLSQRQKWWTRLGDAAVAFQDTRALLAIGHAAARPLLETALAQLGRRSARVRAPLLASLSAARLLEGDADGAEKMAREALALARGSGDGAIVYAAANALCGSLEIRGTQSAGERIALLRQILRSAIEEERIDDAAESTLCLCCELAEAGHVEELERELDRGTKLATAAGAFRAFTAIAGSRTALAILRGNWDEALAGARSGLERGRVHEAPGLEGTFAFQIFAIQRARTGLAGMAAIVERFLEQTAAASRWAPGALLVQCELGLVDRARSDFHQLATNGFEDVPHDSLRLLSLVHLAEVCRALGDRAHARTLFDLLMPYRDACAGICAAVMLGAVSRYLAQLAVVQRRRREARTLFEHALAKNANMGARPALAETQCDYAEFLLTQPPDNEQRRAAALLRDAGRLAQQLSMQPLLKRVEVLGTGTASVETLSARELEVLRLIATGASNQAVAEALFVSHSTVATHVRNILLKLGAPNRVGAVALARSHGLLED